jgi:hypothetical protein
MALHVVKELVGLLAIVRLAVLRVPIIGPQLHVPARARLH